MKICLVTTFPPSQGGLSEYGLHIARELQRNPFIRLTVLADTLSSPAPELAEFTVERCWSFNDAASSAHILNAIRKQKPDVVWFNLFFSTFGRNPLIAFAGLFTPLLSRLSGCYTHVTLHHLIDTVNLQDAGVRYARTYRLAGAVATRMLLLANSVSVLMPGYRKILHEKYGRDNVHLRSHGILSREPQFPDIVPARKSRAPHSGLWQMGNLQAAGVNDRGFSIYFPSSAQCEVSGRWRKSPASRGLCRIDEEKVCGKSENRIHRLR